MNIEFPKSKLTKNQKKVFEKKFKTENEEEHFMRVTIRWDDELGNGHNIFSIIGIEYDNTKILTDDRIVMFGCIHNRIKKVFPELAKYTKWDGVTSDGSSHYIENTLYWARDREDMSKPIGAPVKWREVMKLYDCILDYYEPYNGFFEAIKSKEKEGFDDVEIVGFDSGADVRYTFDFLYQHWATCPFLSRKDAVNFLEILKNGRYEFIKIPVRFNKPVEPNLEYARQTAIAPDATLEQLQDEEWLKARLPKLMEEFKQDVEEIGLKY